MIGADRNEHSENSNDNNNVGLRQEADSFNVDEGIEDEELCDEEPDGGRGRADARSEDHVRVENESCMITQLLKVSKGSKSILLITLTAHIK